ncbi:peptidase U34 [Thermococcus litoralis DSM 5473]|uniref:Peptidase U34 n=1 Tax=Thermococcus litoralis (strain ATCC 51850 / DSM 5473 / JCM 8560 / NS-C) TaxID=523849 RepID=H3ZN51_THELN|nr:C69 family dipeptidase [Thermococcus litoralis]EHR78603.1 peptidase U34 [Thermococcus litoralis DSM 5473]
MCDILVAIPEATKEKVMLFAKNSDRDPNEAQILEVIPRQKHEEDAVKLTYVEFPQVKETYAVILSRPWWIWGVEMGVNEFGLAIGNTAVFTKEKIPDKGILGMDMIRLALERTKTSKEALHFIIDIIESYGQGGNGSYEHKLLYSNSFIIADPKEAWVLETAGKHWVAKRIEDVYSISNALTIENDWDLASESVERLAKRPKFSFAKHFSDRFYTHFAHGRERRAFTYRKLKEREGEITLEYMMEILRSHRFEPYSPEKGSMRDICMHYGGLTRPSQTASSQISELGKDIHWFTGTSLPCLSIFKPISFEGGIPESESPTNLYNPKNYWWRIEKFHRLFQTNYQKYIGKFSKERDELQREIIRRTRELKENESLAELTKWAFEREKELVKKWEKLIVPGKFPFLYGMRWRKVNQKAGLR